MAKDALVILKNDLSFAMGQRQLGEVYVSAEGAYLSRYQENRAQIDRNLAQINRFAASVPERLPISLLLVPNAVGVYPENTPALSDCGSQADTLAYVKQRLSGRVQLLSPYEKLAAHKEEALYYQTDHHWTMRGAYYGYAALMEGLGREPLPLSAFGTSILADEFQGSLYSKAPVSFAAHDEMPYYQTPGLRVQLTYDDGTKTRYVFTPPTRFCKRTNTPCLPAATSRRYRYPPTQPVQSACLCSRTAMPTAFCPT